MSLYIKEYIYILVREFTTYFYIYFKGQFLSIIILTDSRYITMQLQDVKYPEKAGFFVVSLNWKRLTV